MKTTLVNSEIEKLAPLLKGMPRTKKQIHGLNESDAEILKLSSHFYLASSIDSVSEEWVYQLYQNPETLAWVCVHGTLSDLAVCGVKPEGFLFSPLWPLQVEAQLLEQQKEIIFKTVRDILSKTKIPLLGGDQGEGVSLSLTGVALGTSKKKPVTRIGIKPGDYLCTLGELGNGPALGFRYLLGLAEGEFPEDTYRPTAALHASEAILQYASSAIDTSDGFCSALHQLSELNKVRFEVSYDQICFSKAATDFCRRNGLPQFSLCYGEHGDYQALFTVRKMNLAKIQKKLPRLQVIGRACPKTDKTHRIKVGQQILPFEPGLLAHALKNDLQSLRQAFDYMVEKIQKLGIGDVTPK